MIKGLSQLVVFICFGFLLAPSVAGQPLNTNSISRTDSADYIQKVFSDQLSSQSRLYNGIEYQFYNPAIEGSAYFNDAKFFDKGSVVYNGHRYNNVPLMYDLHTDQVISLLHDEYNKFQLIAERIQEFDLYNHHFVRITVDSIDRSIPLRSGFYDEIYAGKISLVAKRTKELKETSGTRDLKKYFLPKDTYYIKKKEQYIAVNNQGSFMNTLGDKKKELQRYLKDNKLRYRKNPEHAMVMLATYYDRISN
jgi:hypothetical protein